MSGCRCRCSTVDRRSINRRSKHSNECPRCVTRTRRARLAAATRRPARRAPHVSSRIRSATERIVRVLPDRPLGCSGMRRTLRLARLDRPATSGGRPSRPCRRRGRRLRSTPGRPRTRLAWGIEVICRSRADSSSSRARSIGSNRALPVDSSSSRRRPLGRTNSSDRRRPTCGRTRTPNEVAAPSPPPGAVSRPSASRARPSRTDRGPPRDPGSGRASTGAPSPTPPAPSPSPPPPPPPGSTPRTTSTPSGSTSGRSPRRPCRTTHWSACRRDSARRSSRRWSCTTLGGGSPPDSSCSAPPPAPWSRSRSRPATI